MPVDDDDVRVVLRVPRAQGAALSQALLELQRVRSARKLDAVRVQVDPVLSLATRDSRVGANAPDKHAESAQMCPYHAPSRRESPAGTTGVE